MAFPAPEMCIRDSPSPGRLKDQVPGNASRLASTGGTAYGKIAVESGLLRQCDDLPGIRPVSYTHLYVSCSSPHRKIFQPSLRGLSQWRSATRAAPEAHEEDLLPGKASAALQLFHPSEVSLGDHDADGHLLLIGAGFRALFAVAGFLAVHRIPPSFIESLPPEHTCLLYTSL